MSPIRSLYLQTASATVELLNNPELDAGWDTISVLPAFRVSGLAGHLARSIFQVDEYLDSPVEGRPPITAAVYFAELEGADDIGSPLNMSIRDRGDEVARRGSTELAAAAESVLTTLRARLAEAPPDRSIQVFQGRALLLDEYLKTRIVEMVVHVEDLALSIGSGVGLPVAAITVATDTVVAAGRVRHGDLAFLRGMTRRERDDANATRIF